VSSEGASSTHTVSGTHGSGAVGRGGISSAVALVTGSGSADVTGREILTAALPVGSDCAASSTGRALGMVS
jgi:hypothetical protein